MKVLDLQCSQGHRFEGWFASADEFESQMLRKLVACPVCAASEITRLPSAPRLNLSGAMQAKEAAPAAEQAVSRPSGSDAATRVDQHSAQLRAFEAQALRMLREVLDKTENVGPRFAEEARRIHYNEAPARNIRGVATPEDTRALLEEGIDVVPLPGSCVPKESLQ
jgi:hypothetical protein